VCLRVGVCVCVCVCSAYISHVLIYTVIVSQGTQDDRMVMNLHHHAHINEWS